MITFKIVPHSSKPTEIVEIHKDGRVVAVMYGDDPDDTKCDVKVVSAHFAGDLATGPDLPKGVVMDNGSRFVPVPAVRMTFDLRPYEIHPGQNTITRPNDEAEKKRARDSIGPGFRGPGGTIY